MAKKARSEEQILRALHQAESGERVADICREHGVSEATFYVWKKKYSGLALNELRELRPLREENGKLKRLVADLSLDRHMLQEIVRKNCKASASARVGALDASRLCGQRAAGGEAVADPTGNPAISEPAGSTVGAALAPAGIGGQPGAVRVSAADRAAAA